MWYRFLCLAIFAVGSASAEQVLRVKDGDTITVQSGEEEVDIRLADIDAPESDQPLGAEAHRFLRSLIEGQEAELALVGGDAYRRIVARVYRDGVDVNAEMVRNGLAWVVRDYDPASYLVELEDGAREAGRGLWADGKAVAPWDWRKYGGPPATVLTRPLPASLTIPNVQCGAKRYCREMASCEEALGHLRQCGIASLDGDRDGMPCEQICRDVVSP